MAIDYELDYSRSQEALADTEHDIHQQAQQQQQSGGLPGVVAVRIARLIGEYVDQRKLGWVSGADTEYKWPGLDTPRKPDVAFVTSERLEFPDADAIPLAPDLAVEVISKTDSAYEVAAKALEYLEAGVGLVWIVNPATQTVEVYKSGENKPGQLLKTEDELSGDPVLPQFKLRIADIFERIPPSAFNPKKKLK